MAGVLPFSHKGEAFSTVQVNGEEFAGIGIMLLQFPPQLIYHDLSGLSEFQRPRVLARTSGNRGVPRGFGGLGTLLLAGPRFCGPTPLVRRKRSLIRKVFFGYSFPGVRFAAIISDEWGKSRWEDCADGCLPQRIVKLPSTM